jgi:hypothetical protein
MEPVFDYPVVLTAYLEGKWRLTMTYEFREGNKKKIACTRYFAEIHEL